MSKPFTCEFCNEKHGPFSERCKNRIVDTARDLTADRLDTILERFTVYLQHGYTCNKNDCYRVGKDDPHYGATLAETEQAIEAYIAERVETAEAKSFKNGFDEGVALHDQDVKCERERISHELKEIAWDDSKVRPGLKQVNLEFALEIVNKPLKSNERVSNE